MGISFELVLNGFGLDNPLIGAISVLVNKLCGFVVVHRVNLTLVVFNIWALNLKALDKHRIFFFFRLGLTYEDEIKGNRNQVFRSGAPTVCWVCV